MVFRVGTVFNDNNTFNAGQFRFQVSGTNSTDTLYGLGGSDIIRGFDGNDVMYGDRSYSWFVPAGAAGNDRMYGGDGNDVMYGDGGHDSLYGENGNDRIYGGDGNDWIDGGYGLDTMDGGAGIDTLDVRFWNSTYELNMNTGVTNFAGETAKNFERVYTGGGNDKITGTAGDNVISTGAGHDRVYAGSGNDAIYGGDGNDTLQGEAGNDRIYGGDGNDWIDGGYGLDTMDGGAGFDTLDVRFWNSTYELNMNTGVTNFAGETARNFERVYTGGGNDKITGTSGYNYIHTGGGNDTIDAGAGNDYVVGGKGSDTIVGGLGNDTLIGVDSSEASPGKGEIDNLTSSSYGDRDRFVLGQYGKVFYDGGSVGSDYAVIHDFDKKNFSSEVDFDKIELAKGHNYRLGSVGKDTYIYKDNLFSGDELIGIVKDVQGLHLANADQFVYT